MQATGVEPGNAAQRVSLTASAGVPLRLYLTKRIPKRAGAPVEAKLISALYAFDRQVLPAGTQVLGRVSSVEPVPRWTRVRAVLGGDFTPLHNAKVEFTSLVMADGKQMPLHTTQSGGLNSLFSLSTAKKRTARPGTPHGLAGRGKRAVQDQVNTQLDRVRSIPSIVRGPDKKELLYDFAMSKLPYHPQSIRNRTRFDAELINPLDFGSQVLPAGSLDLLGSQPPAGDLAHARLVTPLDSRTSVPGDKIEALLTEPVFSEDRKLILPEGTRVGGRVVLAKKAGLFHRSGRLRFTFDRVDLAPEIARLTTAPASGFKTEAMLSAAESGKAPFKVDPEGGVQATESKTRFLNLAAAALITRSAADNESDHNLAGSVPTQNANIAGRTLGGGLGFGLLGSIAAQSSPNVGAALGYYGLAWSVYNNLVARGAEVEFTGNSVIDITFNKRAAVNATPTH